MESMVTLPAVGSTRTRIIDWVQQKPEVLPAVVNLPSLSEPSSRTVKGAPDPAAPTGVAVGPPGSTVGAVTWMEWPVAPSAVVTVGQKKLSAPTTPDSTKPSRTRRMLRTRGMGGCRREARRRRRGASGERPRLMVGRTSVSGPGTAGTLPGCSDAGHLNGPID